MIEVPCRVCKSPILTYPSRLKRTRYCGRACWARWLSEENRGKRHPMFGKKHSPESLAKMRRNRANTSGPAATGWKGGRFLSRGYTMVNAALLTKEERSRFASMLNRSGSSSIPEHRLVMARHLGRPLLASEVVHHRNGVKTDNRLRNLELSDNATHKREHWKILRELRALRAENERLRAALSRRESRRSRRVG